MPKPARAREFKGCIFRLMKKLNAKAEYISTALVVEGAAPVIKV